MNSYYRESAHAAVLAAYPEHIERMLALVGCRIRPERPPERRRWKLRSPRHIGTR